MRSACSSAECKAHAARSRSPEAGRYPSLNNSVICLVVPAGLNC
ncbi:hypothetical protein [Nodularia sphaerocarpa]|nr:hypothetical protein [Nodularia sphaerocarpa]